MIDTNIFNRVVEGEVDASAFDGHRLVATHVQSDELKNTPDEKKEHIAIRV